MSTLTIRNVEPVIKDKLRLARRSLSLMTGSTFRMVSVLTGCLLHSNEVNASNAGTQDAALPAWVDVSPCR